MVLPLTLADEWAVREVTILGRNTEAVFAPFADHTAAADFVIVHRLSGEPIVMLSHATWKRVLATVAMASGEPVPVEAAG